MIAYAIVIRDNEISEHGWEILRRSHEKVGNKFELKRFDAITPREVDVLLKEYKIKWTYPWEGQKKKNGLTLTAYPTKNRKARIACALSHFSLWEDVLFYNEPILILEHDAIFIQRVPEKLFNIPNGNVIGINNPLGATRRSQLFHQKVKGIFAELVDVPDIDTPDVPQGLAGNSAYIINKYGAEQAIKNVKKNGLWPNDATLCKQLIGGMKVTTQYYTKVQGLRSTTTL